MFHVINREYCGVTFCSLNSELNKFSSQNKWKCASMGALNCIIQQKPCSRKDKETQNKQMSPPQRQHTKKNPKPNSFHYPNNLKQYLKSY